MTLWPQPSRAEFDQFYRKSKAQGLAVSKDLLKALCTVESGLRPNVIVNDSNGHKSIGLCQIQLRTARFMGYTGSEERLLRPHVNMYFAAKYLLYQFERYGQDWDKALGAYNQGFWSLKRPNKKYVDKVSKIYENLTKGETK